MFILTAIYDVFMIVLRAFGMGQNPLKGAVQSGVTAQQKADDDTIIKTVEAEKNVPVKTDAEIEKSLKDGTF